MFARREPDPYQTALLDRLDQMYILVNHRLQGAPDIDKLCLETLAKVLNNLHTTIPNFFASLDQSEKVALLQNLYDDYHFIHIDENDKNALIRLTGIGAKKLRDADPDPDPELPLTVIAIQNFYLQSRRIAKGQDIRNSHALIFYKNKIFHYNPTVNPATLTEIVFANLDPVTVNPASQKPAYLKLQAKLEHLEKNRIHSGDMNDRKSLAALLGIPADQPRLQRINAELVSSFLEKFQYISSQHKQNWHKSKQRTIINSLKLMVIAGVVTAILYPLVSFFTIQLCLATSCLLLGAGLGYALYCHQQETFYANLNAVLSQWPSIAIYPGAQPNTPVINSLPHFFKKYRAVLDTAFTEENHAATALDW